MAKSKKDKDEEIEKKRQDEAADASAETAAETAPDAEKAASEAINAEKEKYLRLAAEYDNFRKRSQKEREAIYSDVRADTVTQLLPVYDNLERALKTECSDEAFYKGVEMTMTQLKEIMKKLGVAEIPALGEKFDPEKHNAVMHIEDPELDEGIVIDEFQKGFMLGGKVIRFSVVKVAN